MGFNKGSIISSIVDFLSCKNSYNSIHPLFVPLILEKADWGLVPVSSNHGARCGVDPGQGASPSQNFLTAVQFNSEFS